MVKKLQHNKTCGMQPKEFFQGNVLIFHDYIRKEKDRKSMT